MCRMCSVIGAENRQQLQPIACTCTLHPILYPFLAPINLITTYRIYPLPDSHIALLHLATPRLTHPVHHGYPPSCDPSTSYHARTIPRHAQEPFVGLSHTLAHHRRNYKVEPQKPSVFDEFILNVRQTAVLRPHLHHMTHLTETVPELGR